MRITKNIISREEAEAISSDYVSFVEGDFDAYDKVNEEFEKLKRGQTVITYDEGKFIKAKVSSIDQYSIRAIDGPVVRVSNGEYSWRVDGNKYAYPINA